MTFSAFGIKVSLSCLYFLLKFLAPSVAFQSGSVASPTPSLLPPKPTTIQLGAIKFQE